MKRIIAIAMLVMLILTACGGKTEKAPAAEPTQQTQVQVTQVTEAETQAEEQPAEPEYPGVYQQSWSEEIGGTVVELNAYIVLNEDGTGYWIAQAVGSLTWEENHMTLAIGEELDMALAQENGTVNLLVYRFQDENGEWIPTVFEKIDALPAQIEEMIANP